MEQCLTNDLLGKCAIGARVSFFPCCIMYCYSNQLPKWLSFCLIIQNCTSPSCTMYFSFFGGGMLKHNLGSVCLHTGQVVDPCTLITHEIIKEDILALGVQMNPSLTQTATFWFITSKSLFIFFSLPPMLCHTLPVTVRGIQLEVKRLTFEINRREWLLITKTS